MAFQRLILSHIPGGGNSKQMALGSSEACFIAVARAALRAPPASAASGDKAELLAAGVKEERITADTLQIKVSGR